MSDFDSDVLVRIRDFVDHLPDQHRWHPDWHERDRERLAADLTSVLGMLDAARDLAFLAAFAPEEGAEEEWGLLWSDGGWTDCEDEAEARLRAANLNVSPASRTIGPWKPRTEASL